MIQLSQEEDIFFTLVAYEFSFFSFLSCCLSCVCFWHLFWQFSLGEKGLSAWEISISTKSCQTWASLECSKAIPPPPPSFVKLEFQFDEFLLMFYALLAAAGLAKADPNCVFAQGKLHVILLLTGRKWENGLFALFEIDLISKLNLLICYCFCHCHFIVTKYFTSFFGKFIE